MSALADRWCCVFAMATSGVWLATEKWTLVIALGTLGLSKRILRKCTTYQNVNIKWRRRQCGSGRSKRRRWFQQKSCLISSQKLRRSLLVEPSTVNQFSLEQRQIGFEKRNDERSQWEIGGVLQLCMELLDGQRWVLREAHKKPWANSEYKLKEIMQTGRPRPTTWYYQYASSHHSEPAVGERPAGARLLLCTLRSFVNCGVTLPCSPVFYLFCNMQCSLWPGGCRWKSTLPLRSTTDKMNTQALS